MPGYITGIDPTKVRTSAEGPEFKLGAMGAVVTPGATCDMKIYRYVKSTAGITGAGYVATIKVDADDATMVTTTTAAAGTAQGYPVGVGAAAIPAGGYGWVQLFGECSIQCAGALAVATYIQTTGTAGQVDDAATVKITGLVLTTAAGGAGLAPGFANWPQI